MANGIDPALLLYAGQFLAQSGGDPGNGFGGRLGAGLMAAGQTQLHRQEEKRVKQEDLRANAESEINMRIAMQQLQKGQMEQEAVQQQQAAHQQFLQTLPEDQRAAAAVNPNEAALLETQQANPAPLTANQQEQLKRDDRNFAAQQEQLAKENMRADQLFDLEVQKLSAKPKLSVKDTAGLRKEYTSSSKSFGVVRDYYRRMLEADDSGAGDISLVFAYMKTLDPDSAVRETEYANAENTAGVPDKIRNIYNRAMNGERLAEGQRAQFKEQAKGLYDAQHATQMRQKAAYGEIASRAGADPRDVLDQVYAPSGDDLRAEHFDARIKKLGVNLSVLDQASQETGLPIEQLVQAIEAKRGTMAGAAN